MRGLLAIMAAMPGSPRGSLREPGMLARSGLPMALSRLRTNSRFQANLALVVELQSMLFQWVQSRMRHGKLAAQADCQWLVAKWPSNHWQPQRAATRMLATRLGHHSALSAKPLCHSAVQAYITTVGHGTAVSCRKAVTESGSKSPYPQKTIPCLDAQGTPLTQTGHRLS
jgi:hypothetical protein